MVRLSNPTRCARGTDDAAEAKVAGRRIDRLRETRGRPVSPAVVRRAQMRSALDHFSRDANAWVARIVACFLVAASGVLGNAAGLVRFVRMLRRIPVRGPLPDVAGDIDEAVPVRGVRPDGRGA